MAHPFRQRLREPPPLIYAILDAGLVGDDLVAEGQRLLDAGVDLVQLRAKSWGGRDVLAATQALLPVARHHGVPLIVNDRLDVAWIAGADGVHLGQADVHPDDARTLLGEAALIGWSTHDLDEVAAAPASADYLGFGAMFPTQTRENSAVAGPEALTGLGAASTLPMFAIGGVRPDNVKLLCGHGLAGVAVASGLTPTQRHPTAVDQFRAALAAW